MVSARFAVTIWLLAALSPVPSAGWCAEWPRPFPEAVSGPARLTYVNGLPVMFLQGTPEELGRQQAELVGATIAPMLGLTRDVVKHHGYERVWPLVTAMSRVLMRNAPPEYRQELETFIETGRLDWDGLLVGNSLVELRRMGGCSSFLVLPARSRTGELIFGRNFDFPSFNVLDKYGCISVVRPQGKRAFVSIGYPGMIGVLSGMNDAGLAVATMDVNESADGAPIFDPTGVPLALTYRRILEECATVEEAERLLKATKITTYMNLAVADVDEAVVFELTPQTVGVRRAPRDVLCCTNHFQLEGLCTDRSCRRIQVLDRLDQTQPAFGLEDVHRALHEVNQGALTLQTMIFEPRAWRLHVAMNARGPVSDDPLTVLELREWLQPQPTEGEERVSAPSR
jgi:isopenicillin-N N-acyltransferase-like protein